jgi:hypothetical protein
MMRRCDGTDPNLRGINGLPCDCGRVFDDVEITTVWPHSPVGPKPTLAEVNAWLADLFSVPGVAVTVIPPGSPMLPIVDLTAQTTPAPFANPDPDDDYSDVDLDPPRVKPVVVNTYPRLTETTTRLDQPITTVIRHDRTPHPICDQEATVTAAGIMVIHVCTRFADHAPDRKHICPCRFTWETAP